MLRPTRTTIVSLAVGVLVLAACSSDTDPASVESCDELGDMTIEVVQEMIDTLEAEDVTIDDLASPTETPLDDEQYQDMEAQADGIETRWDELGCSGEVGDTVAERSGELTYSTQVGEIIVGSFIDSGS